MPIVFNYEGGITATDRAWIEDAINRLEFAFNYPQDGELGIGFVKTAEPSCPGHADYMCTRGNVIGEENYLPGLGDYVIEIRDTAWDTAPMALPDGATVQEFFIESIAHEIGHAFTFYWWGGDFDKGEIAPMFYSGSRQGTVDDWNPLDAPWQDRLQEGLAEFFKDLYLPTRVFDNRTNWHLAPASFPGFMDKMRSVICPVIEDTD